MALFSACACHFGFATKVVPTLDHALPVATSEVLASTDQGRQAGALDVIAYLLSHGVWPTPKQINAVSGAGGFEASRKCFLDAMCSAVNPLLVGMILSLRLAEASELAKEGQRQVVSRLQNEVEELLMEVFERLPNTVDGFQDDDIDHTGMDVSALATTLQRGVAQGGGGSTSSRVFVLFFLV